MPDLITCYDEYTRNKILDIDHLYERLASRNENVLIIGDRAENIIGKAVAILSKTSHKHILYFGNQLYAYNFKQKYVAEHNVFSDIYSNTIEDYLLVTSYRNAICVIDDAKIVWTKKNKRLIEEIASKSIRTFLFRDRRVTAAHFRRIRKLFDYGYDLQNQIYWVQKNC